MSWRGRIIGLIIGMIFGGGPIGMLIGFFLGYYLYDKPKMLTYQATRSAYDSTRAFRHDDKNTMTLVSSTFALMGYVARGAGRINESQISKARQFMDYMQLNASGRRIAMDAFNRGKSEDFDLQSELADVRSSLGRNTEVISYLLEIQVQIALADGVLEDLEYTRLHEVAAGLGVSHSAMERLIRMREAEIKFRRFYEEQFSSDGFNQSAGSGSQGGQRQQYYRAQESEDQVAKAYEILGLKKGDSFAKVKSAHRKLMLEYHPDRIAAKGLPPELSRMYSEKAKDIQSAYDLLKKHLSG